MTDIRGVATTTPTRKTSDDQLLAARLMRDGSLVTVDWKQALVAEGRAFSLQLGTEDAPINSTTSIDDQLVWAVVDVESGTTVIPYFCQAVVGTWTSSTLVNFMMEIDNAAARYSSGGTAYTPLNLRTSNFISSTSTAYVGTDVTTSAKTSGGSLELYRESIEVNVGDAADSWPIFEYKPSVCPVIVGPGSWLFHFGAASADVTAYGVMQWFEVPSNSIV
jgi:hypothetical protein